MKIIALILLLLIILTLAVYDIKLNSDGYDILLRNRFTKLGFGIDYKDGLQIWHFARTVHGGRAGCRWRLQEAFEPTFIRSSDG